MFLNNPPSFSDSALLATLVQNCGFLLVSVDAQGKLVRVDGDNSILPPDRQGSFVGRSIDDFFSENPTHAGLYHHALGGNASRGNLEWNSRLFEFHITPIYGEENRIQGVLGYGHDITLRKRDSWARQLKESQLANLLDNSTDGIMLLDQDFVIQRANTIVTQMYGSDASVEGEVCYRRIHGATEPCSYCPVKETLCTGKPTTSTCYDPQNRKHLQLRATPLFDPETGEMTGAFETFRDITEQVEFEEKLKLHESFVDDIFSSIQEGIFIIDRDYAMLRVNPAFEKMYPEHVPMVGKKCYATSCIDHVCDCCPAKTMFETGEMVTLIHYEHPTETKPGMWLEHFTHPVFSADGQVVASICIIRDITKRKEDEDALVQYREHLEQMIEERTRELRVSESKMRAIVSGSSTPIFFFDAAQRLTFVNSAFQELTGFAEAELLGADITSVYDPRLIMASDCLRLRSEALKGERDHYRSEIALRKKSGELLWIDMNGSTVKDADGRVTQIVAVALDITYRKKIMAELEEARKAAEEASNAKSQFLATMSHEIRTPLNGVIGLSDLLLGTELNPKQYEYAQLIKASGKSLLFLINDILDFSKIEAGKLELDFEDFDLPSVIESVLGILASRASGKDLEICTSFSQGLPRIVHGDSGRVRQILLNLVGNSIKFTESGGVHIRAEVEKYESERVMVRFSVTDTGIGIPQDRIDRLFKAFSQADSSSARVYGGTGLGLAISLRLVHLMGGEIGVVSEQDRGSTFWFKIPLGCHPTVIDCLSNKRAFCLEKQLDHCFAGGDKFCTGIGHRRMKEGLLISGVRVLVVDDNDVQRLAICDQLAVWGMSPSGASRAEEALGILEDALESEAGFALVIADRSIDGGTGYDFIRAVREKSRYDQCAAVLLLPLAETIDETFFQIHRADHVSKPVFASTLMDSIMSQLFDPTDSHAGEETVSRYAKRSQKIRKSRELQQWVERERRKTSLTDEVRILVAEDNRINQLVIKNVLLEAGFSCEIVSNGHEACDAAMSGNFHLVLMDCQMPEMDGYEATDMIRKWELETGRNRMPIIALTANATKGDEEKCLQAGMDAYCSKPVDPKAILRNIELLYRKTYEVPT